MATLPPLELSVTLSQDKACLESVLLWTIPGIVKLQILATSERAQIVSKDVGWTES